MKKVVNYPELESPLEDSIFSEYTILDWYDGATLGIGKLNISDDLYLFQMVAYDIEKRERVFTLVKIELDWESNFNNQIINTTPSEKPKIIKRLITDLYSNYFKKVYLFKANDIDDKFYSLKDIECSRLKYFKSIKEILNQNNNAIKEWFWH